MDIIFALATAPVPSPLAIIRISGDGVFDLIRRCFSRKIEDKENKFYYGYIIDEDKKVDEVILLTYFNPKSYTGEDMVEICCHGNLNLINEITTLLTKLGARQALNGEFTSRAYYNNKIDLLQAESVHDLISASSTIAKNLALDNLSGKGSKKINELIEKYGYIIAKIEVNIDYPEYEDVSISKEEIKLFLTDIIKDLQELLANSFAGKIVMEGLKLAIIGKPNVGKSTLLNALIKEDKAITSEFAGTTRDIVEGKMMIGAIPVQLLDTAGIRDDGDFLERKGIEKSLQTLQSSDLLILVLDQTRIDEQDFKLLQLTSNYNRIVVNNKSDLNSNSNIEGVNISALNNDIAPLIEQIEKKILNVDYHAKSFIALTNSRHIGLLERCIEQTQKVIDNIEKVSIDLLIEHLNDSWSGLNEIIGNSVKIDLQKEIFSRFCVGK